MMVFLFVQVVVTSISSLVFKMMGQPATSPEQFIFSISIFSLIVIALFMWQRWTPVNRQYMLSHPWGVLCWTVLAAVGTILPSLWLQDILPAMPNNLEEEFAQILGSRWGYFAVGLFAPIAEEFVFRGAALRALLGWTSKPWLAIVISALLFSLAHMNPAQLIHAFLIGLLLGWMYWRTGSIIPGIVFHWVNNTIAYVAENLLPGQTDHLSDLFGGNQQNVLLSVLFSFCILLPALFQLHLRMRKAD